MNNKQLKEHYAELSEEYAEVFEKDGLEDDIELVKDVLRWKENPTVRLLVDSSAFDLNRFWAEWGHSGYTKNHPVVRKLYRDMGYSISGYWELFFCFE